MIPRFAVDLSLFVSRIRLAERPMVETSMNRSSSPTLRLGSAAFVLVMATLFLGVGCGAATAPNAAVGDTKVMSAPQTPAESLGDAEAQLASAEQNIFGALASDKPEAQGQFAQPPRQLAQPPLPSPTTMESAAPPPPRDTAGGMKKEGEVRAATGASADSATASSSACETACRALASMDRAATHICTLAGDGSDRCASARERVRVATERVHQHCTECSNG